MVARGRRTENKDKEEDKCERRRGMRVKKIYGITRENRGMREEECGDLGYAQK